MSKRKVKNMERIKFILAILVLIVFSTAGYLLSAGKINFQGPESDFDEVSVAYIDFFKDQDFIFYVGIEKGFFSERGIKPVLIPGQKDPTPLLVSNQADITDIQISSGLTGFLNNQDFVWIMTTAKTPFSYGISRFESNRLSEVKNIGIANLGGPGQINAAVFAESLGINSSDITYKLAVTDQAKLSLLERGEIDFAIINTPIMNKDGVYTYSPSAVFGDSILPTGLVSSKSVVGEKGDAINRFGYALKKSIDYIKTTNNQGELTSLIMSRYDLSEEQAVVFYQNMQFGLSGLKVSPEEEYLRDILPAVKSMSNPNNPNRNINDFFGQY